MRTLWDHTTFFRECFVIGFPKIQSHVRLTKFFSLAKITCHNPANKNYNMTEETIGESLDQIVIDAGIEDLPKKPFTRTRHKRRGTIPKFRKRLLLARAQAETVS